MTLALHGKSRTRQGLLVLLAVLAVTLAVMAATTLNGPRGAAAVSHEGPGPQSGDGIDPTPISNVSNPTCLGLGYDIERKVDEQPQNQAYSNGTTNAVGFGASDTVTISSAGTDGAGHFLFNWASNFDVDAVLVKQGSTAHNLYAYSPADTGDTGLGPQHGPNHGSISHVSFCSNNPKPDLIATKTNSVGGAATTGVAFDWTIEVENIGGGVATFPITAAIVYDELALITDITVNSVTLANKAAGISGNIVCSKDSPTGPARCTATGGAVVIPPGDSFEMVVNVTFSSTGTKTNPTSTNRCAVDLATSVDEILENNNTCTDIVEVTDPPVSITVIKDSDPADGTDFRFEITRIGGAGTTSFVRHDDAHDHDSGGLTSSVPGDYVVTETVTPGWTLDGIVCTDAAGATWAATTVDLANSKVTVSVESGDDVTCTFHNTADPPTTRSITICKVVDENFDNDNDGGPFDFNVSNASNVPNTGPTVPASELDQQIQCGTAVTGLSSADTYWVEELAGTINWVNVPGYPTWTITGGASGPGAIATVGPGVDDVTVTFFNKIAPLRTVRVIKVMTGATPPANQTFGGAVGPQTWTKTGEGAAPDNTLLPGTAFDVTETTLPAGWTTVGFARLDGLQGSCTDVLYTGTSAGIPADPYDHTVCVLNSYTPPPTGSITIIKDTVPDDAQNFSFRVHDGTVDFNNNFQLEDDGDGLDELGSNATFGNLAAGSYWAMETLVAGWTTTVECVSAGESTFQDFGAAGVNIGNAITLADGDAVTCTFTNTFVPPTGSITIIKDAVPNHEQDFTFSVTGQSPDRVLDDNGVGDDTNPSNTTYTLPPGTYDIVEQAPLPDGWNLTSIVCVDASGAVVDTDGLGITLASNEDITCTFTNTLDPKIVVVKVNPSNEFDEFIVSILNSVPEIVGAHALADGDMAMDFVPAGTYHVVEQDPTNVGNGYGAPTYAAGLWNDGQPICPAIAVTVEILNPFDGALVQNLVVGSGDFTVAAGDVHVVCVYNTPADVPTWSKVAGNPSYDSGAAQWVITIDNPEVNGIIRRVVVDESGEGNLFANLGTCSENAGIVTCDIVPGGQEVFNVSRVVGQFCEPSTAVNSATAAVHSGLDAGLKLFDLPDQGPVVAQIPGNEEGCDDPLITKTAGGFTIGDTVATWQIMIDNTGNGERTVVINDVDDLVGSPPASCGNPSGDLPGSLTCTIGENDTLVLNVERSIAAQVAVADNLCDGFTVTDTATATVDGVNIQGSPTDAVGFVVPANERFCDSTVTVTKRYDFNENGVIDAADAFVPGWGMTLACSGLANQAGSTAGNGSIVFTVSGDGAEHTCTVTEVTLPLVNVVGAQLNLNAFINGASAVGFTIDGDDTVSVVFLNDPGDQPTPIPTPPGGTPPPGVTTPEVPTPEPTEPVVVETPTPETPEPAPTDTAVESTPVAPDAGSGLAPTSGGGMALGLMLLAVALLASSGALGAFTLARGKRF